MIDNRRLSVGCLTVLGFSAWDHIVGCVRIQRFANNRFEL
jgi:hypothetical protein